MYPGKWQGSETALNGVATYMVEGTEYSFHLNSFDEYKKIYEMLDAVFRSGRQFGANAVRSAVEDAAKAEFMRCKFVSEEDYFD